MLWLYLLIQIILLIIIIAGAVQFFNIIFRGHAPFIATRPRVIKVIAQEIKPQKGEIVYELGSGNGSVIRRLSKQYPKAKYYGLEYALLPWLVAKIQQSLFKSKVRIIKKNFFQADLSQADYIYCFLNIETMAKLEKKFLQECKKGAIIISYIFQLPHIKPYKALLVGKSHLYFYKLRT